MNTKSRLNRTNRHTYTFLFISLLLATFVTTNAKCSDNTAKPSLVSEKLGFSDVEGKSYTFEARQEPRTPDEIASNSKRKASAERKALVLIFVTTDCPIANSYQPLLARLHKEFQSKGFEFVLIHEGPNQSPNKLKEHAKEYSVPFSIVMDAEHAIARKVGATITPEVFVVGPDGAILYQGRIDNLYQGFGKKRATVTREDLRIALSELDSGKSVSITKTDAVGCLIQLK